MIYLYIFLFSILFFLAKLKKMSIKQFVLGKASREKIHDFQLNFRFPVLIFLIYEH